MLHHPLHYCQPCSLCLCVLTEGPHPTVLTGRCPPHSLEDSALLQAVLATIPHGCIVYSLNGPVNGLKDILLQALRGEMVESETWVPSECTEPRPRPGWSLKQT